MAKPGQLGSGTSHKPRLSTTNSVELCSAPGFSSSIIVIE
ncbi:hypothetical protein HMPREF1861_00911 [Corynebacterium kroppenstedtii]|nr:hypothetical protein HMPREF1861_00911 [Corynebacterium kroppenstedtii]